MQQFFFEYQQQNFEPDMYHWSMLLKVPEFFLVPQACIVHIFKVCSDNNLSLLQDFFVFRFPSVLRDLFCMP